MNLEKATLTTSRARDAPLRALHSPSGTMAPAHTALLGFDTLPRPSLRAEPGLVVPQGNPVNLWCKGPPGAGVYHLRKRGSNNFVEVFPAGLEAWFTIPEMAANTAGSYQCVYYYQSRWSEPSEPLELRVSGLFPAPSLSAWPSSTVAPGQDVTLRCHSLLFFDCSALYKDGAPVTQASAQPHGRGSQANFSIPAVNSTPGGTYRCYSFQSYTSHEWSAPSDPLELRVTASAPASSGLTASILLGVSAVLLLLLLLLRRRHRARISKGSREVKKTLKSSDPAATPMEERLYAAVGDGRQTEEARQDDTAAPTGEDPQQVTYAQLKLEAGAADPPRSGPAAPSLYAALR
ncbi:platelet glycoprotein VI-like isoform X2 [Sminthopsis crassicaudata]|uniref:platelet glycoprotein VI-like isoform X2 n=1 Tax=Sminthopsis crassicaudata TaxID=9301 RepID=UPI003D682C1D